MTMSHSIFGHAMEHGIARDPGIVDQHVDGPEVLRHLRYALFAGRIVANVPLVDGEPGPGLKLLGRSVVARVVRGHAIPLVL